MGENSTFRIGYRCAVSIISACLLLAGCLPPATTPQPPHEHRLWAYSDLRLLDPPDAPNPAQDLTGLYLYDHAGVLHLRLELLDLSPLSDADLLVLIDNQPGGSRLLPTGGHADLEWDASVSLPAQGDIQVTDAHYNPLAGASMTVLRDPVLDTIDLSIRKSALPGDDPNPRIQVVSLSSNNSVIADLLSPAAVHADPPPQAPVLLVFWNTLPAYSPIQSMRRWAGAHTGPLGGRHGLRSLLKAANDYGVPLVLLDLKSLPTLSALDYLDALVPLADMARDGLLILPDVQPIPPISGSPSLPGALLEPASRLSRSAAAEFSLPASPFLSTASTGSIPPYTRLAFLSQPGNGQVSRVYRQAHSRLLPIPQAMDPLQVSTDGLSLETRTALLQTALSTDGAGISLLGGDLTASTWGDLPSAAAAMRYLQARPWIHLLDAHDLLVTPPSTDRVAVPALAPPDPLLQRLTEQLTQAEKQATSRSAPLVESAWQALLALYGPVSPAPSELASLRQVYLGQIASLLAAARWAEYPQPLSDCSLDVDLDNTPDCILASDHVYTQYDADTGALLYIFALVSDQVHQVVAPSSQFAVGLSDPSFWQLGAGLQADPSVIPGGFADTGPFQPSPQPGMLTFTGSSVQKIYRLQPYSLTVEYLTPPTTPLRLPLAVDPWSRFSPGWAGKYQSGSEGGALSWGIPGQLTVQINTDAHPALLTFNEARNRAFTPENPNLDYPPGFQLPFPLALLELNSPLPFSVRLDWSP